MASTPDEINDLSQKADYLVNTSSISPKDKDKVSKDLEQLRNTWNIYKNEEDSARTRYMLGFITYVSTALSQAHKFRIYPCACCYLLDIKPDLRTGKLSLDRQFSFVLSAPTHNYNGSRRKKFSCPKKIFLFVNGL